MPTEDPTAELRRNFGLMMNLPVEMPTQREKWVRLFFDQVCDKLDNLFGRIADLEAAAVSPQPAPPEPTQEEKDAIAVMRYGEIIASNSRHFMEASIGDELIAISRRMTERAKAK